MRRSGLLFFVAIFVNLCVAESADSGLERKVLELDLEKNELRKTNIELGIEMDKIKLELLEMRTKNTELVEANKLIHLNCSGLATDIEIMAGSLKTLWEDVESFKPLIKDQIQVYEKKFNKAQKDTPKELVSISMCCNAMFKVVCDANTPKNDYTIIQRRINGKTNFYRSWSEYKTGFGDVAGDFFIGLDNLHVITKSQPFKLIIDVKDSKGVPRHAKYDLFEIGSESEKYVLKKLGNYSGDAGDSLSYHKSQKFSTFDEDNDSDSRNCAKLYKGAWWYKDCHKSNLNGEYGNHKFGEGINWQTFRGYEQSLTFVDMKIKPIN